jgi:hypothetical protein
MNNYIKMEKKIFNDRNSGPNTRTEDVDDGLNMRVKKFIEELTKGSSPQDAARHSLDYRNSVRNYWLEKFRHENKWQNS